MSGYPLVSNAGLDHDPQTIHLQEAAVTEAGFHNLGLHTQMLTHYVLSDSVLF